MKNYCCDATAPHTVMLSIFVMLNKFILLQFCFWIHYPAAIGFALVRVRKFALWSHLPILNSLFTSLLTIGINISLLDCLFMRWNIQWWNFFEIIIVYFLLTSMTPTSVFNEEWGGVDCVNIFHIQLEISNSFLLQFTNLVVYCI